MQRVEATMPVELLDEVMRAVSRLQVRCQMTASQVRYADESTRQLRQYRGASYELTWETRARLEIVVGDKEVEGIVGLLTAMLDKDRKRDDVVLISDVDDAVRVRTGRRGEFAF